MLSIAPELTGASLRSFLMYSVNSNVGSCIADHSESGGILNAYQAIRAVQQHRPHMTSWIRTPQQLYAMRFNPAGHFILENDIDLSVLGNWNPIHYFSGILAGSNRTIRNLSISIPTTNFSSEQSFGLFRRSSGSIRFLTLDNVNIRTAGSQHSGSWIHVGTVAGINLNGGEISSVTVRGGTNRHIDIDRVNANVGGLVGENHGMIISSNNHARVAGIGDLGGIAGANRATGRISWATNWGEVSYWHRTVRSIGGIVGANAGAAGAVVGNTNRGHIHARNELTDRARMGTIIGYNRSTFSTNNVNHGTWHVTYRNPWIGTNQGVYAFKNHGARVGRQE